MTYAGTKTFVRAHSVVEHVERGEQRCRAVALAIMRHGAKPFRLNRQARLGRIERRLLTSKPSHRDEAI